MTLVVCEYDSGVTRNQLVACPLCGYSFDEHERRWKHFLHHHGPADAGLTPLGERRSESPNPATLPDAAGPPARRATPGGDASE